MFWLRNNLSLTTSVKDRERSGKDRGNITLVVSKGLVRSKH